MSSLDHQDLTVKIVALLIPIMTAIAAIMPRYRRMSDLQVAYEIGRRVGRYESRNNRVRCKSEDGLDRGPLATEN